MKLVNKISLIYFVAVLPVTLFTILLFPDIMHSHTARGSAVLEWTNMLFGLMWGVWMVNALYIGTSLIASRNYRENLLKKLTCIKERDEREELIVAKATRNTFLFNLGVMIFLLLIATLQIKYEELPPEQVVDGHKHNLSLGLRFNPWAEKEDLAKNSTPKVIYNSNIPLTASGILMLLIVNQLGSYYFYARRSKL